MEDSKHTAEPWKTGSSLHGKSVVFLVGDEPANTLGPEENWIDCNTEADARRIVACVNACAGIDTEHLEQAQADHAEESEGGYLADVETRLEHTDRELAHRSAALFERQQRVLSVMDELKQAVEARLAAEAQRDKLLWAVQLLLCDVEEAEYMTRRERVAEARAVIAQVKGGAEC